MNKTFKDAFWVLTSVGEESGSYTRLRRFRVCVDPSDLPPRRELEQMSVHYNTSETK